MMHAKWLRGQPAFLVLDALLLAAGSVLSAETVPNRNLASENRLRRDVTFLASDECEGRGPMTAGLDKAADYIAAEFKKAGLRPGGSDGSYFQPFTIPGNILDAPAHLALVGPRGQEIDLKQGTHFWPMGLGGSGKERNLPAVFAGYGITQPKANYDDYEGLDAHDKVVFLLRGAPHTEDRDRAKLLQAGAPFVTKLANAEKHGAAAVVIVNDADTVRDGDGLLDFNYTALGMGRKATKLPVFHARRSVLETMLPGGADALAETEKGLASGLTAHGEELKGWKVSLEVKAHSGKVGLKNVVGVLEGAGPLAGETIVVGAHYDHLGYGGVSSLANLKKMAIHHGADDNGSGSTALMELARRFAALPERKGRRLVFIAFSGEELGLFGSAHYCKEPLFPLKDTAAMFNLDMVGRLRPDKDTKQDKVLTEGSGTAKPFAELLATLSKKYDFKMSNKAGGFGPSDHASFCAKKVPVLFVWTGVHEDYHRPSDTADKINVPGMRRVVDFSEEAVAFLARMERPEFVAVKDSSPGQPSKDMPRLGIRPDYSDDADGVLIGGVVDGQPAARAGMKADDRIVEIAGKPVKNLQGYMQALSSQKKGSTIDVVIIRDGKRMTLPVKLE
jgi:hypothetical protein